MTTDIPAEDRTIVIPADVYLALEDYAADKRKGMPNELMAAIVTPKSAAQSILRGAMIAQKYLRVR